MAKKKAMKEEEALLKSLVKVVNNLVDLTENLKDAKEKASANFEKHLKEARAFIMKNADSKTAKSILNDLNKRYG